VYLQEQQATALPKSPLDAAIGYALRNWAALIRYTENGRLKIDNNGRNKHCGPSCSAGSFDVIFASHVLEHLPSPTGIFERFAMLLRRGGSLFTFVPNCGGCSARELGVKWGPMCCEKHPLALDGAFFHHALPKYGFSVRTMSDPYNLDDLMRPNAPVDEGAELSGDELMVWAKKSA
jgi:SAM-dependent methyltransferase